MALKRSAVVNFGLDGRKVQCCRPFFGLGCPKSVVLSSILGLGDPKVRCFRQFMAWMALQGSAVVNFGLDGRTMQCCRPFFGVGFPKSAV